MTEELLVTDRTDLAAKTGVGLRVVAEAAAVQVGPAAGSAAAATEVAAEVALGRRRPARRTSPRGGS